ncbi:MAG: DUF1957 domain-containing protein [Chloroflexi bacterium]|nr:DUF1957 domain-containing protein [Chloroflexota bacterium]MCL5074470.1 DUF1957 domain-containing protein [Chloroflexota bacterium]
MKKGYFTFVLHSHLPYVRKAGRWPHGEEMVHEALAETYIPLLNALNDLKDGGYQPKLNIGFTPILLEQIADSTVLEHFELYLLEEIEAIESDIKRFERGGQGHLHHLARFYHDWYSQILTSFQERYKRDVVGGFRRLQDSGNLNILTSAATHGYLPLLERDSNLYGQLKVGVLAHWRHFGRRPQGIWLPECGYRPAYYRSNKTSYYKPGIEEFLADFDLHYFFTDSHVIAGGQLVGKVAGDVIGPYGRPLERKLAVKIDTRQQARERTTARPYYVQATNVAVYGRDERTGLQVWSASQGYPGDPLYREFHRKDAVSGLQYWRVTGHNVDLGEKELYDPSLANSQALNHARHFVRIVGERLLAFHEQHSQPGIIVSAYDSELFGHWWFEGVVWLKEVLRLLETNAEIGLTTAEEYLDAYPPEEVISLPESSWGEGGQHWTWFNPQTEWMWPLIHNAEQMMEHLVSRYPQATEPLLSVLNQAGRELLLLESSDWPFLISTGQAAAYASARFQQHLARFNHLNMIAASGQMRPEDRRFLALVSELDNPFPDIDYRFFADREGERA